MLAHRCDRTFVGRACGAFATVGAPMGADTGSAMRTVTIAISADVGTAARSSPDRRTVRYSAALSVSGRVPRSSGTAEPIVTIRRGPGVDPAVHSTRGLAGLPVAAGRNR